MTGIEILIAFLLGSVVFVVMAVFWDFFRHDRCANIKGIFLSQTLDGSRAEPNAYHVHGSIYVLCEQDWRERKIRF